MSKGFGFGVGAGSGAWTSVFTGVSTLGSFKYPFLLLSSSSLLLMP